LCGYMLVPSILLTYVSSGNVSRLEEAPSLSTRGDNSDTAPTPNRPNLGLSTQVKVLGSEETVLKDDPSQMGPLIESMKTCHSFWKGASDRAKHYKAVVTQLQEEVKTLRDANVGVC
jgi:hypothetical protein